MPITMLSGAATEAERNRLIEFYSGTADDVYVIEKSDRVEADIARTDVYVVIATQSEIIKAPRN